MTTCKNGTHEWPSDYSDGDTCNCGGLYLFHYSAGHEGPYVIESPAQLTLVSQMSELLRSAHAIAARKGADVAWERFAASIQALGIGSVTARTYRVLPSDAELPTSAIAPASTPDKETT